MKSNLKIIIFFRAIKPYLIKIYLFLVKYLKPFDLRFFIGLLVSILIFFIRKYLFPVFSWLFSSSNSYYFLVFLFTYLLFRVLKNWIFSFFKIVKKNNFLLLDNTTVPSSTYIYHNLLNESERKKISFKEIKYLEMLQNEYLTLSPFGLSNFKYRRKLILRIFNINNYILKRIPKKYFIG